MDLLNKQSLADVLALCYRMMVASAPLLEFAIPRSWGALLAYYKDHLYEERGHEEMVQADLESFGVVEIPHSFVAAEIAGSQYYLVAHEHPAMLLGYMHALESSSLTLEQVTVLEEYHKVKLTALRHHSTHDPQHAKELSRMINTLDAPLLARVVWNEKNVTNALIRAFQ